MAFTIAFFTLPPFMALLTFDLLTHAVVTFVFRKADSSVFAYNNNLTN